MAHLPSESRIDTTLLRILEQEQKALARAEKLSRQLDRQMRRLHGGQSDWKPRKPR